ncbi:MAG: rhodanese-like domain-containing protein [Rhodocyclaceae bacterium]
MEHLTPNEAHELLKSNPLALFVDCRSEMEFLFVGHPVGAMMIPWNDGPNWDVNPDFVAHVKKAASVDRPVVIICRSGNRSQEAGHALEQSGFTQVYNVLHGFEGELDDNHQRGKTSGWRFEGLPWEQC